MTEEDTADPTTFYAEGAETYADRNAEEHMPTVYDELRDTFMALVGGGYVLDAGCGHGRDVDYFQQNGLEAVGVDTAHAMIALAREDKQGLFEHMDIRDMEYDKNTFDGIWCNFVLHFFQEDTVMTILEEFARILKPGGTCYLGVKEGEGTLEREKLWGTITQYLLTETQLHTLLKHAEFSVVKQRRSETTGGFDAINIYCAC